MVDLPVVLVTLTLAVDPEPPHFVPEAGQGSERRLSGA